MTLPEGKQIERSVAVVMMVVVEPSNSCRIIGGTEYEGMALLLMKVRSTKQCVEPESTSAGKDDCKTKFVIVTEECKEFGSERVDTLSQASFTHLGSMQLLACAESRESLPNFLSPKRPLG